MSSLTVDLGASAHGWMTVTLRADDAESCFIVGDSAGR